MEYFKKINKNPAIKIRSGGIIRGSYPLEKHEAEVVERFGIKIKGKPQGLSVNKIFWADLIIISADNVPRDLFKFKKHPIKVIVWKIRDFNRGEKEENIRKIVKQIIKKVECFNKSLKNEK